MKKIFKILSIFVMVFVLFSCANPSSDSTSGSQPSGSKTPVETPTDDTEPSGPETPVETPSDDPEPSGPETPVETPSDDPVEETPAVPTYSIIFTAEDSSNQLFKVTVDYLNTLPEFKNLEEGTEVMLYKHLYLNRDGSEITKELVETSVHDFTVKYDDNSKIDSVVIGNKDVKVKVGREDLITFK